MPERLSLTVALDGLQWGAGQSTSLPSTSPWLGPSHGSRAIADADVLWPELAASSLVSPADVAEHQPQEAGWEGPALGPLALPPRPAWQRRACPLTCVALRVAALLPILQQMGGAVRGGHLRGHHVPSHLVGGPHRHRRGPLPPALRHLQEARCACRAARARVPHSPEATKQAVQPLSPAKGPASGSGLPGEGGA